MTTPVDWLRGWGLDLLLVGVLTVLAVGVLFSPLYGSPVALVSGVPFLLFLPGYALVAALFPEQPVDRGRDFPVDRRSSPSWLVRLALSLLASVLVVGVAGVVLEYVVTLSLVSLTATITTVTLCGVAVAAIRRDGQPAPRRADPFAGRSLDPFPERTPLQSLALGVGIVALVAATAFVGVTPVQAEDYSEVSLVTEDGSGELTAEGYPTTFVAGEGHRLSLALANYEHERVSYAVVVVAQRVGPDGAVTARERVDRFGATLDHGESTVVDRRIDPTLTGDDVRLRFLVYEGTAPDGGAEADHTLQLWVDVESGA